MQEGLAAEEVVGNTGRCQREASRMAGAQTAADLSNIIRKCSEAGMRKTVFVPAKPFFAGGAILCQILLSHLQKFAAYEGNGQTFCRILI